jgi:hypothetical protein
MRLFQGEPRVLEGFSVMAYFAIFSIHSCMFLDSLVLKGFFMIWGNKFKALTCQLSKP